MPLWVQQKWFFQKVWSIANKTEKIISDSDLSFASNSLLKSGTFGSRPRKQKPRNEWRQRRNESSLSRFQLFTKVGPLHKHLLDIFYTKFDWMYRDNLWILYVINAAELVSFFLWRHTPSAIFSARPPRIFMFQQSWTELIAETARNRQLRSPIKPFKFVRTPKKLAQLFRATKSFQKQKNYSTKTKPQSWKNSELD